MSATTLYRLHTGGTLARHEDGGILKLYEVGHTIELAPEEAARLNAGRSLADSRVVKVGGEMETTTPKARRLTPETVRIEVATPGTPGVDELIAMGTDPAIVEAAIDAEVRRAGERLKLVSDQPEMMEKMRELAVTDDFGEEDAPEPATPEPVLVIDSSAPIAAEDEVAPDWATYLAGVSAADAAEALRTLESTDDVQTALDAEAAGLRRPLVIRAGNATARRLRKS